MKSSLPSFVTALVLAVSPRVAADGAGSIDSSFVPGTGPNGSGLISAAVAQADGKVIVVVYFTNCQWRGPSRGRPAERKRERRCRLQSWQWCNRAGPI